MVGGIGHRSFKHKQNNTYVINFVSLEDIVTGVRYIHCFCTMVHDHVYMGGPERPVPEGFSYVLMGGPAKRDMLEAKRQGLWLQAAHNTN